LPDAAFVFCSFNNAYKITPEIFAAWMRLLVKVEGSVLWLLAGNPTGVRNLKRAAEAAGIDPSRLVFASRAKPAEHLARHRLADLFLDTLPYNAHTTASDALWAGVPHIAYLGDTFSARVSASIVSAMGVPELIVRGVDEYRGLALRLVRDREALAALRARITVNRLTAPLFDSRRFIRHLEAGYLAMWQRRVEGRPPDHIAVTPAP
jgi:predicted O-linked N-acetylglucosamine transferase (SPINDLY family)